MREGDWPGSSSVFCPFCAKPSAMTDGSRAGIRSLVSMLTGDITSEVYALKEISKSQS